MNFFVLSLFALSDLTWAVPNPTPKEASALDISLAKNLSKETYVLPMFDPSPSKRAEALKAQREGYLYGLSLIGNASYFPSGKLGDALVAHDLELLIPEIEANDEIIEEDIESARKAVLKAGGIQSLASYDLLYRHQWKGSNPTGVAPGVLTNYTQDIFFSMERLSNNPFSVIRLDPSKTDLPFDVDRNVALRLTSSSLTNLHATGRLFLVDHSYQAKYPGVKGHYGAACSAYFYIHPATGEFLPLAIKTNVGSDLVYTPLDSANDWLLAKMMFNMNDFFHAEVYHLASTHDVAEIVHQAALHTMADQHPVRGFLDQIMYRAYAIRPQGAKTLFNPGGPVDQNLALNHEAAEQFVGDFYPKIGGLFQLNYLQRYLIDRGLINCAYGPSLAHFPFAEDAGAILASLRRFATSFVEAYYTSEDLITQDAELQDWLVEASGPAQVLDFPAPPMTKKQTLIDILTHMAYLTGVEHHALNSGTLSASSAILPFHPLAFYQPIPKAKGVVSVLPFLADVNASIAQVALAVSFNRPNLMGSVGDLEGMFSTAGFLGPASAAVARASTRFRKEMMGISQEISARRFDQNGLAQGMPFIWRSLDPGRIPFFLNI